MADEFESVELEISEDDILYYLVTEDGEEIGFVIEEDGREVECYYEGYDADDFEELDGAVIEVGEGASDGEGLELEVDLAALDGEVVEMEIDEDAIDHYLFDEAGNEIGFAILEDGAIVECFYAEEDDDAPDAADEAIELLEELGAAANVGGAGAVAGANAAANASAAAAGTAAAPQPREPRAPEKAEDHGYLYKMASIAGFTGNKARKKAGEKLDRARESAAPVVEKARTRAEEGVDKATEAVTAGGAKIKAKQDEYDLGITREGVAEATSDLNAIAKEGAETAKELKEAYDDIMDSFGFLMPKKVRRRLP